MMQNHGNAQKTPFQRAINRFAEGKIQDALQLTGKALPCSVRAVSGSIVTVKFAIQTAFKLTLPDVTCPMFGPQYIRYPIQPGCLGVVFSADAYLGGVSGLGGGTADLSLRANLSSLVFFPIANNGELDGEASSENWPDTDNADALVLYGPDGAIIRTLDKKTTQTINKDDGVAFVTDKKFAVVATDKIDLKSDAASTFEADGETLTIGGGSIATSGQLKAGNGTSNSVVISGHTITVVNGIVTVLT